MTSKKGSLWKTSWNRGRGTPIPNTVGQMAFFQNFAANPDIAQYETTANSTLGLALPYWYAVVGINPGTQLASSPAFDMTPQSDDGIIQVLSSALLATTSLSLAAAGDSYVSAALTVVQATPAPFTARTHFVDQVMGSATGTIPYAPNNGVLRMDSGGLPGGVHGMCGGPGVPTLAEIKEWFRALKANLAIQAITGKTTHLYSAAAVFPLVPVNLTNLGTDGTQNMKLVTSSGTPAPQNNLITVRFAY